MRERTFNRLPVAAGVVAAVLAIASASSLAAAAVPAEALPDAAHARVERGAYLVNIMSCNDCHTPWKMGAKGPEPDRTRLLSGHPSTVAVPPAPALPAGLWGWIGASTMTAFSGPWGVSFTANLTPDPETGLGKWTEAQFVEALRTGRHQGKGRPILPPMPWQQIRNANDEDLKAIFAYLRSIPAIKNRVPAPIDPPEAPARSGAAGSPSESPAGPERAR